MKKVIVLLTVIALLITMVSCSQGTSEEKASRDGDAILEFGFVEEDVIVNDIYIGFTYSYGDYHLFNSYFHEGYLVFLDTMEGKIEIIDISHSASSIGGFLVTYKLIDDANIAN